MAGFYFFYIELELNLILKNIDFAPTERTNNKLSKSIACCCSVLAGQMLNVLSSVIRETLANLLIVKALERNKLTALKPFCNQSTLCPVLAEYCALNQHFLFSKNAIISWMNWQNDFSNVNCSNFMYSLNTFGHGSLRCCFFTLAWTGKLVVNYNSYLLYERKSWLCVFV